MDIDGWAGLAPSVAASWELFRKDAFSLSPVLEFQYFGLSENGRVSETTTTTYYYTPIQHPEFGSVAGATKTDAASVRTSVDLDLYVLSLGLQADWKVLDCFSVYGGFGPTVTLAGLESSCNGASARSHQGVMGLYAALGATCHVTDAWSLSAGVRYDMAFREVRDRNVKQELDGMGATLKIAYAF